MRGPARIAAALVVAAFLVAVVVLSLLRDGRGEDGAQPERGPDVIASPGSQAPVAGSGERLAVDEPGSNDVEQPLSPRLHGRVVDAATNMPLAGLALEAKHRTKSSKVTSAADGTFRFDEVIAPGEVKLYVRLPDGGRVPALPKEVDWSAADDSVELRASIGPRYLVEVVGPAAAHALEWEAQVVFRGTGERAMSRARQLPPERPAALRFPSAFEPPRAGEAPLLVLREESGNWSGEAPLPTLIGEPPGLVRVVLEERATLSGTVVDRAGAPVERARVYLCPAPTPTPPNRIEAWQYTSSDDAGAFDFTRLVPGDYHLRVAPPDLPIVDTRLTLAPGPHDTGKLIVAERVGTGRVAGVVRSASGAGSVSLMLHLESAETGFARSWIDGQASPLLHLFYNSAPQAVAPGRSEVSFAIEDVPPGRYRLLVAPLDAHRYSPLVQEISAPIEDLVIVREDTGLTFGIGFRVTDARTGAALDPYVAQFTTPLWRKPTSRAWRSGEELVRVMPDGELSWAVYLPGFRPVYGDISSFADIDADPRLLDVVLEPGWGAEFEVRDGRDPRREFHSSASGIGTNGPRSTPLAGVSVLADGAQVGVTDEHGLCRVELDAEPQRVDFVHAGWSVSPSTTFADGRVLEQCRRARVWLVRD